MTKENYQKKFFALVQAEECQMEVDIRHYDLTDVKLLLYENGRYLKLNVPGLQEKRPSVLYGDRVYVTLPNRQEEFSGFVHGVEQSSVLLKFHKDFHRDYVNGLKCAVRFSFNRSSLRRIYDGIILNTNPVLQFPWRDTRNAFQDLKVRCMNFNDKLNDEQRLSVVKILNMRNGQPFVIFGPPGTGKTMTVVEAIKNVLHHSSNARILVTAPSNSACDLLLGRLANGRSPVKQMEMFRLNAMQRSKNSVLISESQVDIMKYSSYNENLSVFDYPRPDKLQAYKVIVSTCVSSAVLWGLGVPKGHFTHIFVDESAQATEPETFIPFQLANAETRIILAGDPKQLGPVIRSTLAKKHGLELSYLERVLLQTPDIDYRSNPYVSVLLRNYRSHKAILDAYSPLFYDPPLQPFANPALTNDCLGIELLKNSKFPIMFFGIEGKNEREANSPSWFNPAECMKVLEVIYMCKEFRTNKIQLNEIGVIAPYRKQVEKIRKMLSSSNLDGVSVGSAEEFQGQERRVIIISTVRSSTEYIATDVIHNLGFLRNPKRFNVAISRAKSMLIIIGNPHVLRHDKNWLSLLEYCQKNGAYSGPKIESRDKQEDDFMEAFEIAGLDEEMNAQNFATEESQFKYDQ